MGMDFTQYISQNALILVPVLYIIGIIIKNSDEIKDKYIPAILLVIGILGAVGIMGISVDSIIQGVLVTGVSVYTNQLIKQTCKKEWRYKILEMRYMFPRQTCILVWFISVKFRTYVIYLQVKVVI